jgi:uroporphyrinogen decarboxylase
MSFTPDYTQIETVLYNKRPKRLPLYEHHIDDVFIAKAVDREIGIEGNTVRDYNNYYRERFSFWRDMTYDAMDYEASVCDVFPGHGAIFGGIRGPIQSRDDFNKYPFEEIPTRFWKEYTPHLDAIRAVMPDGMKVYGGCGYGIFEASEDLVGYENLAVLQYTDPDLFRDLYIKVGDIYAELWSEMVRRYDDIFVFYRMGDDLGYKNSTLLAPETIKKHILPQYQKVINIVHSRGKKFLLHSCGNIFSVMDDIIELGIDAKHSNEDEIAPFEAWVERYSTSIGLLGGIDVNTLCMSKYDEVYEIVYKKAAQYRNTARGFALGSGNSIAGYVPVESFLAMVDAAKDIRKNEV